MLRIVLISICWLVSTLASVLLAQDFRVQVAAYADSMPITYFQSRGLEKVLVTTDQMGVYRYYAGVYKTREQAEKVLEEVVAKGFPNATIIDLEEQRVLSAASCPYNRPGRPTRMQDGNQTTTVRYLFFDLGSSTLSPESRSELDLVARALQGNSSLSLKIIGQTDGVGDPVSNVELATSRARSARDYLINRGIRTDRMVMKVFGEAEAEYPNKDEKGNDLPENRKWNRRVLLALIDPNGPSNGPEKQ